MGNTAARVAETGFAEFTALLVSETLEAVIAAQLSQEGKMRELAAASGMPPEEYADRYLTPELVSAELLRLFPGVSAGVSSVAAGAPYRPAGGDKTEEPPVAAQCGYEVTKEDVTRSEKGLVFTPSGAERIRRRVAFNLASLQQLSLAMVVQRGIPRVVVDHGRIAAKLTLSLTGPAAAGSPLPEKISGISLPGRLRLQAQPLNTRGPEVLGLKTDITSEVEIAFKTILE